MPAACSMAQLYGILYRAISVLLAAWYGTTCSMGCLIAACYRRLAAATGYRLAACSNSSGRTGNQDGIMQQLLAL